MNNIMKAINTSLQMIKSEMFPPDLAKLIKRKNNEYYKFLYFFSRITSPKTIVELGTGKGVSALCLHLSQLTLPEKNKWDTITIDIDDTIDKSDIELMGIKPITGDVFDKQTPKKCLSRKKIDILFIDINCYVSKGNYTQPSFLSITKTWLPFMKAKSVIFIDDINLNDESKKNWIFIAENYNAIALNSIHNPAGFGAIIIGE